MDYSQMVPFCYVDAQLKVLHIVNPQEVLTKESCVKRFPEAIYPQQAHRGLVCLYETKITSPNLHSSPSHIHVTIKLKLNITLHMLTIP